MSTVISPALTTIHVPKQYMGEIAVRRLRSLMENPGQPPIKIEIDTTLICRGSVEKMFCERYKL
ncbi:substrate-binding domain-containing protein [Mediterraneibacter massiliensis]|uniref:substrate-binding domain-containing protein n=1 Tax=Mediterraneibacter massiliensis TaxID=1720300 RepID=UPI0024ADAF7D|nr:substrate-binding domain-containing protein [Mediterraneibacter massiliensis]